MPADAFEVMVSRISGIVGGTLISLLLAVTVYPSADGFLCLQMLLR